MEEAVEYFTQLIHQAAALSTPNEMDNKSSNFIITTEIRTLIRRKRRLRKIWQRTRQPANKRNFNRAANHLKRKLKDYKNNCTGNFLTRLSPNNYNEHKLWIATKYLKRPQRRNVPIKNSDGIWCKSDKSKADAFKLFLENTFTPFPVCN